MPSDGLKRRLSPGDLRDLDTIIADLAAKIETKHCIALRRRPDLLAPRAEEMMLALAGASRPPRLLEVSLLFWWNKEGTSLFRR